MYVHLTRVPADHFDLLRQNAIQTMHHIVLDHLVSKAAAFGEESEVMEGFRYIDPRLNPANGAVVEEFIEKLILAHLLCAKEGQ